MCEESREGSGVECSESGFEVPHKLLSELFLEGGFEAAGEDMSELCRCGVS